MPLFGLFGPPNVERLKARGNVEGLVKALSYKKDDTVRRAAALALGAIGGTEAVGPLIAALKDGNSAVRRCAASELGDIGDARAFEPLISRLSDSDRSVGHAAARALAKIDAERAVDPIARLLEDRDCDTRIAAAEVLGEMRHPRAAEPLIAAIEHATGVRSDGGRTLHHGWHPHRQAAEAVRRAATRALSLIGEPALEPLLAACSHRDQDVRQAATGLLGRIGGERAVEALIGALKNDSKHVRMAAVQALARVGGQRAVESLGLLLKDTDSDVREEVAKALIEVGDVQSVELLIAALRDRDRIVRLRASEALAKIGSPAVDPLVAALKAESPSVRDGAMEALAKIGWRPGRTEAGAAYWAARHRWDRCVEIGASAVEPLIRALPSAHTSVRPDIATALGAIGDRRAVSALIAAMAEAERERRSIEHEHTAEDSLAAYMDDDSPGHATYHQAARERVQKVEDAKAASKAAARALQAITGRDFGESAAAWQQWWEGLE
jgi:HEAT repeat protein